MTWWVKFSLHWFWRVDFWFVPNVKEVSHQSVTNTWFWLASLFIVRRFLIFIHLIPRLERINIGSENVSFKKFWIQIYGFLWNISTILQNTNQMLNKLWIFNLGIIPLEIPFYRLADYTSVRPYISGVLAVSDSEIQFDPVSSGLDPVLPLLDTLSRLC